MKRKARCVWDYLTNFELAGVGSLVIALGDSVWLLKESQGYGSGWYYLIALLLLLGVYLSSVSIYRHHQKHYMIHKAKFAGSIRAIRRVK